jgi:alkanesulfonate monooxygenase SsuD/methylene tetrahydromethanopterin reductase-like flavin-dependent oxidoreductase (luciferase family)
MDFGLHLPLMSFQGEGISRDRVRDAVRAADGAGFAAVSSNDHFLFATPWLDGPTALASVIDESGRMELATTIALAVLRGPVPLAKALAAIDLLSDGRLIAGVGPGSSQLDYDALGVPFEERWARLDEVIRMLRSLLAGDGPEAGRFHPAPAQSLAPRPVRQGGVPIWVGSWGSPAGLRRVARLADGWIASAYNTSSERFAEGRALLGEELRAVGREPEGFPNALATMWTWVTEDAAEAERMRDELLAPLLRRDAGQLRGQVCVGPAAECAQILSAYAEAGCERVYFWALGEEPRQVELLAEEVFPQVTG